MDQKLDMEQAEECKPQDKKVVNVILSNFVPKTEDGGAMWEILAKAMEFEKIIAIEVDHCPQSYACLLIS